MLEAASEATLRGEISRLTRLCGGRREQVANLVGYLDKQGLYSAPASASYHSNHDGGLIEHSINVTRVLLILKSRLLDEYTGDFEWMSAASKRELPHITDESCVIVGLFHDAHKVCDGFGRACYVPNVGKGGRVSEAKPYEVNKDMMAFSGAYKSVLIVSKYIGLYEHETQAIGGHDGQYISANRELALREHPLLLMLSFADLWSASLVENKESWLYKQTANVFFME